MPSSNQENPPHTNQGSVKNESYDDTLIISSNRALDGYRLRNFYLTNAFQGFVWMVFHFSVVFFFTFQLKSVALVGIFLGFANFIAFLLDIPIGILQRYYTTKKLFIIGALSQLIAVGIFFNFIYGVFSVAGDVGEMIVPDGFSGIISWFFSDALNWILIILASFCYGLTKEVNDISTFGYILSHAHPSEYPRILARNNITYGIGSLTGLIVSGIVLSTNPTLAILFLGLIITGFLAFTYRFFDNTSESVSLDDIKTFTVGVSKLNTENVKEYLTHKISAIDLESVISTTKYIFIKPPKKETTPLDKKLFFLEILSTSKVIYTIMTHMPIYMILYWTMSLVLVFGFWDTFASTFLISFLDDVKHGWSYILLACIAIPALGLQELIGRISEKVGIKTVAFLGLGLSGVSMLGMGMVALLYNGDYTGSGMVLFIGLALINSMGYACGMALGQNQFLDAYNKIYAKTLNLKEIDANAAAGPMKILQNAANVIGLIFGGILLGVFGYSGFFFLFGLIILAVLIWSIRVKERIEV